MMRVSTSTWRLSCLAGTLALGFAVTACGPSPEFTTHREASRTIVTAIRDAAPAGYLAGKIEGGSWPNEGRGPNLWVNLRLSGSNVNAASECARVREWAVRVGATQYQDGNDGNNPVLPIAGNESRAQATCLKWWQPALSATESAGGPVMIYTGTYTRNGKDLGPFTFEANAGVDLVAGKSAPTKWVAVLVSTSF